MHWYLYENSFFFTVLPNFFNNTYYYFLGSNAGIIGTTKEHLGLALALNVPVFVVVTKIDMCPANVLEQTLTLLLKVCFYFHYMFYLLLEVFFLFLKVYFYYLLKVFYLFIIESLF